MWGNPGIFGDFLWFPFFDFQPFKTGYSADLGTEGYMKPFDGPTLGL